MSTNYEAPHYAAVSTVPLLHPTKATQDIFKAVELYVAEKGLKCETQRKPVLLNQFHKTGNYGFVKHVVVLNCG
jgi:hypothetical protein